MPSYILFHKETCRYLEYSTIVDAPTTRALSRDEMQTYLRETGEDDEDALEARLRRAEETGTSSFNRDETLRSVVRFNKAGKDETTLTFAQFVRHFFIEGRDERDVPKGTSP